MNLPKLIYEAKQGCSAAEEALFNGLSELCLSVCMRYIKNEADAEERMVDGFYKFFKSIKNFSYKTDESLYACLNRIMINECIMQLRKKKLLNIVAEPSENDVLLDTDQLDKISIEEIHKIIRKLPEGARTVFNLYAIEGWKHEEIASMLDISVNTSKSQFARARTLLQQSLKFLNKNYGKHESK